MPVYCLHEKVDVLLYGPCFRGWAAKDAGTNENTRSCCPISGLFYEILTSCTGRMWEYPIISLLTFSSLRRELFTIYFRQKCSEMFSRQ